MSTGAAHLGYALAWIGFGLAHSLLARGFLKDRLRPLLGPAYRLAYNLFAAVQIAGVLAVGWVLLADQPGFVRPSWIDVALGAVYLGGWGLMLVALSGYDLGRLSGLAQLRAHFRGVGEPEDEPLRRDGLHRFVRHPAYAGAFLILWGQAVDPLSLATAVWGSVYLLIGSYFEERWLRAHYGAEYEAYRRRVPAYVPWRGRVF